MVINQLIKDALLCKKERPRFAYLSPYLVQTKQVAWDYAKYYSAPIPGVKFNESELKITYPNGATLQLLGADNPDRLRGIYLDGIAMDEYAQIRPNLFTEIIRPALTDREGYAIFLGTPNGKNHFWEIAEVARSNPEWFITVHKASDTGYVKDTELLDAAKIMSRDEYAQEYECSFEAAIKGAYYADEFKRITDEKRISKSVYNKDLPVYTAWDIGYKDDTAIIFYQLLGKEIRIIDSYSNSGLTLPEYVGVLRGKGYTYKTHFFPWDARIKPMSSGKSTMEVAREFGLEVEIAPSLGVNEGIQQARMILERCWFDEDKTKDLVNALTQYRREYDEDKKSFRATPLHDWSSHFADAMRYLAISLPRTQGTSSVEDARAVQAYINPSPIWQKSELGMKPDEYANLQNSVHQYINSNKS